MQSPLSLNMLSNIKITSSTVIFSTRISQFFWKKVLKLNLYSIPASLFSTLIWTNGPVPTLTQTGIWEHSMRTSSWSENIIEPFSQKRNLIQWMTMKETLKSPKSMTQAKFIRSNTPSTCFRTLAHISTRKLTHIQKRRPDAWQTRTSTCWASVANLKSSSCSQVNHFKITLSSNGTASGKTGTQ